MVKLLMVYAKGHNIILKINSKDRDGNNPMLYAQSKNATEIINLLENYAKENDILLNY